MTNTASAPSYRFLVIFLCFLLVLVNYMDRGVISFAIAPIKQDFGLDDTGFGLIISAFALGTLSVNLLSGWLVDHINVKTLWTAAIFFWSFIMILLGMVHMLTLFIALRYLLGIGEGVNFPAMNRSLADWMQPEELSRSASFSLLGVPLAMLIGSPILAHMIDWMGWRWSFLSLGVLGLVVCALWWVLYRAGPYQTHRGTRANTDSPTIEMHVQPSLPTLLKNPTLLATSWSFFAFGYVLFFAISWMPGYLEQTYGMELTTIGWYASLPWAISIVLMLLAGWISDTLMRHTGHIRRSRVHLIWICQLIAVAFFIPLIFSPSATEAIILLSLAIGFSMMPNGPYYSICTDLFREQTGAATGILITFFSLSGIVSPLLTGWLTDLFGGFAAAFSALAVFIITAILGLLIFAHPDAQ